MKFTIIEPLEKYYKQRVALRVAYMYNQSLYISFWAFSLFLIAFLILYIDQDDSPSKLFLHEGKIYRTTQDPHLLRLQLSGLSVLLIFLRLVQLLFTRYRFKKLFIRSELRTIDLCDSETIMFDDNKVSFIGYDNSVSFDWSFFKGWTILNGFLVFSDHLGFHSSSVMLPVELFTEEQLDFIKQKLPEIK